MFISVISLDVHRQEGKDTDTKLFLPVFPLSAGENMGGKKMAKKYRAYSEDVETAYLCGSCCEQFETKSEAKACCQVYICEECGCEYESIQEAKQCYDDCMGDE